MFSKFPQKRVWSHGTQILGSLGKITLGWDKRLVLSIPKYRVFYRRSNIHMRIEN